MAKTNKINNVIANNPFRRLGLAANCSTEDIKQAINSSNRKTAFTIDLRQLPTFADNDTAPAASELLSSEAGRIKHALLWFVIDNITDKKSLALARQNKTEDAVTKLLQGESASNLHNAVVLCLINGKLNRAVQTARQLYTKHLPKELQLLKISDGTISLPHIFLDFLIENATISQLVYAVSDFDKWSYYVVQQGNSTINKLINDELTKFKTTQNGSYSEQLKGGEQLYHNTIEHIKNLRLIHSIDDDNINNYNSITDTVANEILQSAINYASNSGDYDAPVKAITVMEMAAEIAVSQLVRARCAYNIKTVQKHIKRLPPVEIREQVDLITKSIKRVSLSDHSIDDAENLLKKTLPILSSIKNKDNGQFYTRLMTKVCSESIACINTEIEKINNDPISNLEQESGNYTKLFYTLKRAMSLSDTIGRLNMTYELRNGAYAKNRQYLKDNLKRHCISFSHKSISNEDLVVIAIAIVIFFFFIIAFVNIISGL